RVRADARRAGHPPSAAKLAWADWTVAVTNGPAERPSTAEARVLLRARWQVELLFKRWRSGGWVDAWRRADPDRILCEVWATLIILVLQHWLVLVRCRGHADRGLTRAATTVRDWALPVALALVTDSPRRLRATLAHLRDVLTICAPIDRRRSRPATFQLLADPSLDWP
ncbi:MAG: transposase, partial [Chloroflexota bacterium]|nr:transposase [Chloroflexota bacterium]